MSVNFTMLVRDRFDLTKQALTSLQDTSPSDMEITILDDSQQQETQDWVHDWSESWYAMLDHTLTPTGTGHLRNKVIERSEVTFGRRDYLVLSDNDVFFRPDWLNILIRCYEFSWEHGFKVIGAVNHPYHQPVSTLPVYGAYFVNQVHALALQSMIMKWEVWDKYGPFCQTPAGRVCASEDVDFARKITADGGKLGVVSPALVVNTGITNSFGEKIPGWELVKAQCPEGVICE